MAKVLVVMDKSADRRTFKQILSNLGHQVICLVNPKFINNDHQDAQAIIFSESFDLEVIEQHVTDILSPDLKKVVLKYSLSQDPEPMSQEDNGLLVLNPGIDPMTFLSRLQIGLEKLFGTF